MDFDCLPELQATALEAGLLQVGLGWLQAKRVLLRGELQEIARCFVLIEVPEMLQHCNVPHLVLSCSLLLLNCRLMLR